MTNKNETTTLPFPIEDAYTYADVDCTINFKYSIGLVGVGAVVTQIANNVVDDDGYYPYYYDNALYGNILSAYSDFTCDKAADLNDILTGSDIVEVIERNIDEREYRMIINSVDKMIDFKKQQFARKSEFDGLISDIRSIVANLNDNYIKPLKPKTFERLINNLSKIKLDEKSLVSALVDAKVIDKKLPEKENKESAKSKVINLKGEQVFDGK